MTIVTGSDYEKVMPKLLRARSAGDGSHLVVQRLGSVVRDVGKGRTVAPALAPVDGHKNAKDNAGSNRSPCGSATGLPAPPPETAARQPALVLDGLGTTLHMVPDQHWPDMWRIAFPNGRFSNMLNITRAKDALLRLLKKRLPAADIELRI